LVFYRHEVYPSLSFILVPVSLSFLASSSLPSPFPLFDQHFFFPSISFQCPCFFFSLFQALASCTGTLILRPSAWSISVYTVTGFPFFFVSPFCCVFFVPSFFWTRSVRAPTLVRPCFLLESVPQPSFCILFAWVLFSPSEPVYPTQQKSQMSFASCLQGTSPRDLMLPLSPRQPPLFMSALFFLVPCSARPL